MVQTLPDMSDSRRDYVCFDRKFDLGEHLVKPRGAAGLRTAEALPGKVYRQKSWKPGMTEWNLVAEGVCTCVGCSLKYIYIILFKR